MRTTMSIIMATVELLVRFEFEKPEKYMLEIFGTDDPVLAEKCQKAAKSCPCELHWIIFKLKEDERNALVRYINKRGY